MTPDMLPTLALSTMGVAVGVFIGALIGINIAKRNTGVSPNWLFRGSVYATAFLASMGAWFVAVVFKGLLG
ncbi:hypothetical protein [Celeribacter marinus]|uniref:hypothetical protein n=1 Tax=Celeribacter marinus TaxID=1397108 RepID=UPI003F6CEB63